MTAGPRLGVLLSGSGRTLKNLVERIEAGRLQASIVGVVSDRSDAFGLQRAEAMNLPHTHLTDNDAIWRYLRQQETDLVCLCGYLRLLPVAADYSGRILNIHPSLLPAHGGKGMYGDRVHRAVLASGDEESGCTVHICNDEYDRGPIVVQERVPVLPGDEAASLAARVFAAECEAYPRAIEMVWNRIQAGGPSHRAS
jgi:phosphoribosylglycinamide formyltransferase-1